MRWLVSTSDSVINWSKLRTSWQFSGKQSTCRCRRCKRPGFHLWVRKIPWRKKWQPTPIFLSGKPHGERSLAGYSPWHHKRVGHDLVTKQQQGDRRGQGSLVCCSPWDHKELDTTQQLNKKKTVLKAIGQQLLKSIPWRRHGNPLQYSCLENPHEQRSLVGQSMGLLRVGHN